MKKSSLFIFISFIFNITFFTLKLDAKNVDLPKSMFTEEAQEKVKNPIILPNQKETKKSMGKTIFNTLKRISPAQRSYQDSLARSTRQRSYETDGYNIKERLRKEEIKKQNFTSKVMQEYYNETPKFDNDKEDFNNKMFFKALKYQKEIEQAKPHEKATTIDHIKALFSKDAQKKLNLKKEYQVAKKSSELSSLPQFDSSKTTAQSYKSDKESLKKALIQEQYQKDLNEQTKQSIEKIQNLENKTDLSPVLKNLYEQVQEHDATNEDKKNFIKAVKYQERLADAEEKPTLDRIKSMFPFLFKDAKKRVAVKKIHKDASFPGTLINQGPLNETNPSANLMRDQLMAKIQLGSKKAQTQQEAAREEHRIREKYIKSSTNEFPLKDFNKNNEELNTNSENIKEIIIKERAAGNLIKKAIDQMTDEQVNKLEKHIDESSDDPNSENYSYYKANEQFIHNAIKRSRDPYSDTNYSLLEEAFPILEKNPSNNMILNEINKKHRASNYYESNMQELTEDIIKIQNLDSSTLSKQQKEKQKVLTEALSDILRKQQEQILEQSNRFKKRIEEQVEKAKGIDAEIKQILNSDFPHQQENMLYVKQLQLKQIDDDINQILKEFHVFSNENQGKMSFNKLHNKDYENLNTERSKRELEYYLNRENISKMNKQTTQLKLNNEEAIKQALSPKKIIYLLQNELKALETEKEAIVSDYQTKSDVLIAQYEETINNLKKQITGDIDVDSQLEIETKIYAQIDELKKELESLNEEAEKSLNERIKPRATEIVSNSSKLINKDTLGTDTATQATDLLTVASGITNNGKNELSNINRKNDGKITNLKNLK